MNLAHPKLRMPLWIVLAAASLSLAWANGLGFVWSGAWNRPFVVAAAAAYLPLVFGFAWLLVPVRQTYLIVALLTLCAIAIAVCLVGTVAPDSFPLKITFLDFLVLLGLPLGAYVYRWLRRAE